jgi:hypothetical protein
VPTGLARIAAVSLTRAGSALAERGLRVVKGSSQGPGVILPLSSFICAGPPPAEDSAFGADGEAVVGVGLNDDPSGPPQFAQCSAEFLRTNPDLLAHGVERAHEYLAISDGLQDPSGSEDHQPLVEQGGVVHIQTNGRGHRKAMV